MPRFARIALAAILGLGALIYGGALAYLYVEQRPLEYVPEHQVGTPADKGLPTAQVLHLTPADGVDLVAWYQPPADDKPLVLFLHGNAGALPTRAPRLRQIAATGMGFFAIDYRGFGASTGSPTEPGLIADATTAYDRVRQLGFAPERIIDMGESLGTGVAVALATQRPVRAVILDSPFSSVVDVAADRYPLFPVRWLLHDPFHSDERIANIHAPLLILHGERDQTVPYRFGQKLFSLAVEPKTFIGAPTLGHLTLSDPEMFQKMLDWLTNVTKP